MELPAVRRPDMPVNRAHKFLSGCSVASVGFSINAPGISQSVGINGLGRRVAVKSHSRRPGPSNDSATQPEGWIVTAIHPSIIFH